MGGNCRGHQTAPESQQKEGRIRQHHSSKEEAKTGVNCSQHGLGHTLSLSADTSAKGFIETRPAFHHLQYFIVLKVTESWAGPGTRLPWRYYYFNHGYYRLRVYNIHVLIFFLILPTYKMCNKITNMYTKYCIYWAITVLFSLEKCQLRLFL